MNLRLMLILLPVCIAVVFLIQNVEAVEVRFLFWSIAVSSAIVIFFTLIIGFLVGWFLHSFLSYRKSKKDQADYSSSYNH
ncbi:MAG: LapA family protein [Syntrophaceae bacterium]|nr:LapA family protein [Syntrophaceae bacterium]